MATTPGNVGVLKVRTIIAFCHPAVKIPMNCVLHAEDSNIAMVLDVILVGLGHQRNG